MDLSSARSALLDELSKDASKQTINVLKIREICRNFPGVVATTGLRVKVWSLLLLGKIVSDSSESITSCVMNCREQQVLEADVKRTRADYEEFRTTQWRKCITDILQNFCVKHDIQYKQGMNEVLAPFIYLHSPPKSNFLPYALFEAFIFRYLERFFCLDDSSYLFKSFRLFHTLLLFHDPQLALHLQSHDFPPELYSPQWFLTLYSRSLPLPHVLRLWDVVIAVDDPAFTFFIGLCLLRRLKVDLLLSDNERIPEIVKHMKFTGEEDIDVILTEATKLYKATPRCFCRLLRFCCVSTTELAPTPGVLPSRLHDNDVVHEQQLAIQSVRKCLMISAQELVSTLLPVGNPDPAEESLIMQYVFLDIRSMEEAEQSGSGTLPRALQFEPDFVEHPDALDKWIQHFDKTRGCNICIIDLPPGNVSNLSLWKRLLLGEGDGFASQSNTIFYNAAKQGGSLLKGAQVSGSHNSVIRDTQSRFPDAEDYAIQEDSLRPAVKMAVALQQASFPNVCVLDGGYPALLQALMILRGSVEPVIINYDSEIWESYLTSTGRAAYSPSRTKINQSIYQGGSNKTDESKSDKSSSPKAFVSPSEMSEAERFRIAIRIAKQLGHVYMAEVLSNKLEQMSSSP